MNEKYTKLGFKTPRYVENRFGIKIYLGTTGKDNWSVEIPKKFIGEKYEKYCEENFTISMVSEECVLAIASKYTLNAMWEETEGYNM